MNSLLFPIRWIRNHPEIWGWIALASLCLVVIYAGILILAVIRMSPDYFSAPAPAPGTLRQRYPVLRLIAKTLKTILGLALLTAGIAMLILPGQGLVTVAVAITFLEFPGKRRLLTAIVRRGGVMSTLNGIRRRAGKEPLLPPECLS
jgi:drug/metabolite transporter (DMT)-like permease